MYVSQTRGPSLPPLHTLSLTGCQPSTKPLRRGPFCFTAQSPPTYIKENSCVLPSYVQNTLWIGMNAVNCVPSFSFHTLPFCCCWWSHLALTLGAELLHNGAVAAASGAVSTAFFSCFQWLNLKLYLWETACLPSSYPKLDLERLLVKRFHQFFHQNRWKQNKKKGGGDRQLLRAAYSRRIALKLYIVKPVASLWQQML